MASLNKIETYEDEATVVRAALTALGPRERELGGGLRDVLNRIERTRQADIRLATGRDGGLIDTSRLGRGMIDAIGTIPER